ncbi:MAG TPA: hypothetical protein VNQ77_15025 [Frankiaceae bacterium]|nr:hypothetical protein [Frankiaceae bacterium]
MSDSPTHSNPPESSGFATAGDNADIRNAKLIEQIESRRLKADTLLRAARAAMQRKGNHPKMRRLAERDARLALALYAGSLDWAEDTEWETEAHHRMDEAGSWVRRTFGCWLARTGTSYKQTCPVALGHNRIGFSVGGTARVRICSLCGEDVSECEHLPNTAYLVPGGPTDLGWCRVCLKESCNHLPGEEYRVDVVSIIREMEVEEVSIVSKPAHPEARITEINISVEDLYQQLGDQFTPGMQVSCDRCLLPCQGLIRHDVLHG